MTHTADWRIMKNIIVITCLLCALFFFSACSGQTGGDEVITENAVQTVTIADEIESINIEQTGYTAPVPSEYFRESDKPGTIEEISYKTKDYAGNGGETVKYAYVYLPYGYDADDTDTHYDILYLMHGWGGHAGEYFEYGYVKEILDHLIGNGEIKPLIVVSPTFYTEDDDDSFGTSVAELRAFHSDFENALMPAVEGKYHTYAASASDEDLKASRGHRAFGGFSLGSVTTWMQFCYDYDYIRYFIPMSGSCWYYGGFGDFQTKRNVDFIEQLVKDNNLDERGYFVYQTVGTWDGVKEQTTMMAEEMLERSDVFTPQHYVFYQREGGQHDYNSIQEFLYNALPVIFETDQEEDGTEKEQNMVSVETEKYFNTNTKINDVVNDPAFGNYGRLIFPVNFGYYSGSTLGDLSMTWYNYIDPDKTVEIVNYMKSHAVAGDTIFYDIYTEEEKRADPAKRNTGLFFFKGEPGKRFAICNAGGGMAYVGAMHDSFPHALELSKMGYNAFALIYRPGAETACEDLARAIAFIFGHAEELEVDTSCYSLWGGSAGARMAAWLGVYGTAAFGETDYPQAGTVVMQYTGLSQVFGNEPPTYNCVGTSDWIADYQIMENRIARIKRNGTDAEIDVFDGLPHGFGLGTGTAAEGWINNAVDFWERQME